MTVDPQKAYCQPSEVLQSLLRIMEIRDASVFSQSINTAELSMQFGAEIGLAADEMQVLRFGALLHDIGMLAIPDFISFKPATLSPEEWIIIRQHPEYGVSIVEPLGLMADALPVIERHHECWNGSGYPHGKRGEEIPFLARIVTITSTYNALTTDKIYRPGHSKDQALAIMQAEAGKIFDPDIFTRFSTMVVGKTPPSWTMEALLGLEPEISDESK